MAQESTGLRQKRHFPAQQNVGNYGQGPIYQFPDQQRSQRTWDLMLGYLPNFQGDKYTSPQAIQSTRNLNQPFFYYFGMNQGSFGQATYPTYPASLFLVLNNTHSS